MKTLASYKTLRALASVCALSLVALQLLWEHFTGGVASHHLLNRADLPAISNYWGLFTLPLLTWLAMWRAGTQQRPFSELALGIAAGFMVGIIIAALFRANLQAWILHVLGAAMVLGLAFPAYRLECLLGFFLGLMFVFGGVLPLLPALPIVLVSYLFRVGLLRGILKRR